MHSQGNDLKTELKQENVLTFIRSEFEGFDNIVDIEDGIYSAINDFAIYLRDGMNEDSLPSEECKKAFDIMNTMGESKDLEVNNLLVVGILEILADEEKVISLVREGLKGTASEMFERVMIGWNNS